MDDFTNSRKLRQIFVTFVVLALLVVLFQVWYFFKVPKVKAQESRLTHRQEVWRSALEWCESKGINTAVNPKDKDGTPSYYAFQFKTGTFDHFATKYAVQGKISDYEAQEAIVGYMILDKSVNFRRQFPDCVRKLGLPPLLLDT